ncbi:MAG: pyruvate kinase [Planctomycetia bacterium]|nr:pyruvate kinase [Planctomycetia bacterium]
MAQSANQNRARTKIIATVGPACREDAQLAGLYEAGVDIFRLNTAHGNQSDHEATIAAIRRTSQRVKMPIGALVDLAGPKIRLGELAGGQVDCRLGATFRFVRGASASRPDELVTTYDRLLDELEEGRSIMLADGTVSMLVEKLSPDAATVRVTQQGSIRSRQGVNLPGARISLPAMSDADRQYAAWAAAQGADFVGLSFVRSPDDVRQLKSLLRSHGSPARVIAKIEKQEALDELEAIVAAADGLMVARGDLGVEIDVARMPVVQKEIVATCNHWQKPVIIATQMLDSMQRSSHPTRAEVTDVANAILDGCDACMLSGETAIGEFPRAAVEMMNRIALATEPLYRRRPLSSAPEVLPEGLREVTQAVVLGAGHMAQKLDARLIVVASHTGATALALAKQRSFIPTVGVSDGDATLRQMTLYWGVTPLAGAPTGDMAALVGYVVEWGRREGTLATGDKIVLVTGTGLAGSGHNAAIVHEVR